MFAEATEIALPYSRIEHRLSIWYQLWVMDSDFSGSIVRVNTEDLENDGFLEMAGGLPEAAFVLLVRESAGAFVSLSAPGLLLALNVKTGALLVKAKNREAVQGIPALRERISTLKPLRSEYPLSAYRYIRPGRFIGEGNAAVVLADRIRKAGFMDEMIWYTKGGRARFTCARQTGMPVEYAILIAWDVRGGRFVSFDRMNNRLCACGDVPNLMRG